MTSPFLPSSFTYGDAPQGGVLMPMIIASRNPSNTIDQQYAAGYWWLSALPTGSGNLYYQGGNTAGIPNWTLVSNSGGVLNTLSDGTTTVNPSGGNIALVGIANQIHTVSNGPGHEINIGLAANIITPGAMTVTGLLTLNAGLNLAGGIIVTGGLTTDTLTSTGATLLATTGANVSAFGNTTGASGLTLSVGTGNLIVQGAPTSTMWIGKGLTMGTLLIGGSAMTGAGIITLGSSSVSNEIDIGAGAGDTTVKIANGTTGANVVDICDGVNVAAQQVNIGSGACAADMTINILNGNATAGTLACNIFGAAAATTGGIVNIGTGIAPHTVNVGHSTAATASKVQILVGTGSTPDFKLDGLATSTYAIGSSTTTGTIVIGGTAMTGAGVITLGSSSATSTVKIASGAGASTVTIGEGTAGANTVSIINGTIGAVGTVNILSGVGTVGAAGSILRMANNQRVATIDLGNVAPAASRTTTIGGGTVIVAAVTDTINIGSDGATTNANSVKTVNINTGTVAIGQVLTNIASGTVTSGTHTTSIASGNRAAGTMLVNLLTGTGTKSLDAGNADGLTTFGFKGAVNINDSQNSNTQINTGTSTGTISIGNAAAGAITVATAAGVGINAATASHFTVTGAAADLTLSSVGGSVNITASEAAADAIVINATNAAGGVQISAGTNNIVLAGNVLKTTSPAFLLNLAATQANVTGNGTVYTIGTGATLTKIFDRGTNATTSGVFTAPVTGIYNLKAQVTVTGATIATTYVISIVTTSRTYSNTFIKAAGSQDESIQISSLCDMTTTDTAHVTITVTGEAGDTDDILGAATVQTYFTGYLVA
jgi:hypothetical protein